MDPAILVELLIQFPGLSGTSYAHTSPATPRYNCIAWAASDDKRFWWPVRGSYWPRDVPRELTLAAFEAAYATRGFVRCADGTFEAGYEKVAIYATDGKPTHAARQVAPDRWASKLGQWIDIEHQLSAVEGTRYGKVAFFMRRSLA